MGRHDDVLHGDFVQLEQPSQSVPAKLPAPPASSTDTLQSLLATIKQDLKDAAQI